MPFARADSVDAPMKDNFGNDREEFMDLKPAYNDKKFSVGLWNKGVQPTCRALMKLSKVVRLSAGFDSSAGKEYYITVWTDRDYAWGAIFVVRPLANRVTWTGRDLQDDTHFQGDGWDKLIETVKTSVRINPALIVHKR